MQERCSHVGPLYGPETPGATGSLTASRRPGPALPHAPRSLRRHAGVPVNQSAPLRQLVCARDRASRQAPALPSPEFGRQQWNSIPRIAAVSQNIRSAGLSVPNDPTFAIARLIRIWLSLRASPIESLRSSTLKPQQSVLYVICEIEYRKIDCR